MKKRNLGYALLLLFSMTLLSCGHDKQEKKEQEKTQVHEVKGKTLKSTLYFTGEVLPLNEQAVTSPVDATVKTIVHNYGQHVDKGETIIILDSQQLQKEYQEALTAYLKAKDTYDTAKSKFVGTKDLWDAGIIPKNTFVGDKSALDNNHVALFQARRKLEIIIKKIDPDKLKTMLELDVSEAEKIKKELETKYNIIELKAPQSGIVLQPPKSGGKEGELSVGSQIKAGQVVALIGDLNGIAVNIKVSEIDIGKLKQGLHARVKGVAFADHKLQGTVVRVNNQASSAAGSSGGLPIFNARVEVNKMSEAQQKVIKVGMSAAIEVDFKSVKVILVPIDAVYQDKGKTYVNVQTADGKSKPTMVTTGATSFNDVIVKSGLKPGDKVVYTPKDIVNVSN